MATATARKPMRTDRYPGWDVFCVGSESYLMTRPGHIFAIGVGLDGFGAWSGTLLTRQGGEWRPSQTPFNHCVLGCTQECDRREKHVAKCNQRRAGR